MNIIVCEIGCICVVKELIKGGVIVNLNDGYYILLIVVC